VDFVIHKTKNMKYTTHMQNFHIIIVCQVWNNERIKKLTNKENVLKSQKLASTNERICQISWNCQPDLFVSLFLFIEYFIGMVS